MSRVQICSLGGKYHQFADGRWMLQTDVVANIDLVDIDGVIGVGKSVEYGEGPFKKYVPFWTKFDPLPPLCHKLSHMAEPPIKNMYRLQYPPPTPQLCA